MKWHLFFETYIDWNSFGLGANVTWDTKHGIHLGEIRIPFLLIVFGRVKKETL